MAYPEFTLDHPEIGPMRVAFTSDDHCAVLSLGDLNVHPQHLLRVNGAPYSTISAHFHRWADGRWRIGTEANVGSTWGDLSGYHAVRHAQYLTSAARQRLIDELTPVVEALAAQPGVLIAAEGDRLLQRERVLVAEIADLKLKLAGLHEEMNDVHRRLGALRA